MARKSRKNIVPEVKKTSVEIQTFSTAIYVRLSVENSGKGDSGDSIENQTDICRGYIEERPYLNLYGIYADNGEKGWKFDRPEFTRLMDDVKSGKVNCIVVKDLSRFGRDYIETGNYLEKIFPFLGVRFIAVTDHFDSFTCGDAEKALMVPLKNMVNDVYAKDISRKILTTFRQRQEKGEILPGWPPYGYVKSKTVQYRYEVDREVAPYVKMIFKWKAEGVSVLEIARRLDDLGAPTPSQRKVQIGLLPAEKYKNTKWRDGTINRMITNPSYTGAIVYGRQTASLYEGIKHHLTTKDEWIVLEGMHEPIVSKELFDRVQEVFEENRRIRKERIAKNAKRREGIDNRFEGKVFCGDCGKKMRFFRAEIPSTRKFVGTYQCFSYKYKKECTPHHTRMALVEEAVYEALMVQMDRAKDIRKIISGQEKKSVGKDRIREYEKENVRLQKDITIVNKRRRRMYEDYVSGVIDEDEYRYAKKEYDDRTSALKLRQEENRAEKEKLEALLSGDNPWLSRIMPFADETELTDKMIDTFVSEIRVFEGHKIEVVLNYLDDCTKLERLVRELEG